jgi:hypothetical protein
MAYKDPPKDKQFTSENQPKNPGRPLGRKNRSTIARMYLDAISKVQNPLNPNEELDLSYEEAITLAQIAKALKDKDTAAYNALMDSAFGKAKQTTEAKIEMNQIRHEVVMVDPKQDDGDNNKD